MKVNHELTAFHYEKITEEFQKIIEGRPKMIEIKQGEDQKEKEDIIEIEDKEIEEEEKK